MRTFGALWQTEYMAYLNYSLLTNILVRGWQWPLQFNWRLANAASIGFDSANCLQRPFNWSVIIATLLWSLALRHLSSSWSPLSHGHRCYLTACKNTTGDSLPQQRPTEKFTFSPPLGCPCCCNTVLIRTDSPPKESTAARGQSRRMMVHIKASFEESSQVDFHFR